MYILQYTAKIPVRMPPCSWIYLLLISAGLGLVHFWICPSIASLAGNPSKFEDVTEGTAKSTCVMPHILLRAATGFHMFFLGEAVRPILFECHASPHTCKLRTRLCFKEVSFWP